MNTAPGAGMRPALGSVRPGSRRYLIVLLVLATSATLAACAESGGRLTGGDNTRITTRELSGLDVGNAYDAVVQLRPLWLRSRGMRSSRLPTEIIVAQNGRYFGPISSLRQFQIQEVKELRYLDGPQAGAFLSGIGSRHVEGAILIELR